LLPSKNPYFGEHICTGGTISGRIPWNLRNSCTVPYEAVLPQALPAFSLAQAT
jgi:hypothetical protein